MPKKKSAAVEAVAPDPFSGYRRPFRLKEFRFTEYPGLQEGETPLTIEVPVNLSFDELQYVTDRTAGAMSYEDAFKELYRYIVKWNVTAIIHETGERELLPPPAEAGWEIMKALDHVESHWVIDKVKFGYLSLIDDANEIARKVADIREASRKKDSAESVPSDETPSGDDSASAA